MEIFSYKTAFYSPNNPIGQRVHPLLNVFNVLTHEISWNFDKSCIETWKIGKFWNFCHFRSQFKPFSRCVYFFTQASRATNSFFAKRFRNSKLASLSKDGRKFHKIVKNLFKKNFKFQSEFEAFFHWKIVFFLWKSLLDNEFVSFFNVFNIISPQIYQKFEKKCKKIRKFRRFCHSGVLGIN